MSTHKNLLDEAILMRTHKYLHLKENREDIPTLLPDLALLLTHISSNYPRLEHIFMVPKVFEPLKFYCIQFFRNTRES